MKIESRGKNYEEIDCIKNKNLLSYLIDDGSEDKKQKMQKCVS